MNNSIMNFDKKNAAFYTEKDNHLVAAGTNVQVAKCRISHT